MIDTRTIVVPESHSIISEAPSFVNKGRYWFYDVRLTEEAPNQYQKIMLEKEVGGYSIKNYKQQIYQYLESQDLTNEEKYNMWKELFE